MAYNVIRRVNYLSTDPGIICLNDKGADSDFKQFHLPGARLHDSTLHGAGVAAGLELDGAIGSPGVTVHPGVAIDPQGRMIVLADQGTASVGDSDPPKPTAVPAVLDTTPLGGKTVLVTIRFHEAWVSTDLQAAPAGMYEQQPWLQLLAVGSDVGDAVVLGTIEIDDQGKLKSLSAAGRQVVVLSAGELSFRRGAVTGATVTDEPAGTVGPDPSGQGLRLAVPGPNNTIALSRADGGPFASLVVHAGTALFDGKVNVGVASPGSSLEVSGDARISGELTVANRTLGSDRSKLDAHVAALDAHVAATSNPHNTNAQQVGALPLTGGSLGGPLKVGGELTVGGTATAAAASVTGNLNIGGTLTAGQLTTAGATFTGNVAMQRYLAVASDLEVKGSLTAASETLSGTLTIQGGADSLTPRVVVGRHAPPSEVPPYGLYAGISIENFPAPSVPVLPSPFGIWISPDFRGLNYISGSTDFLGNVTFWSPVKFFKLVEFSGGKHGYVVDRFINRSGSVLRTGDVVRLKGTPPVRCYGSLSRIPVPEVVLADNENDTAVVGIVASSAATSEGETEPTIGPEDLSTVPDGDEVYVVTLGTYAHCRADATRAPIEAGDLLTTSTTPGHARKAAETKVGTIIGKALQPLKEGRGTIAVLVSLH